MSIVIPRVRKDGQRNDVKNETPVDYDHCSHWEYLNAAKSNMFVVA